VSEPHWTPGLAYILDADGRSAFPALPAELAHFIVARVNAGEETPV
jgi:hypothetical protein